MSEAQKIGRGLALTVLGGLLVCALLCLIAYAVLWRDTPMRIDRFEVAGDRITLERTVFATFSGTWTGEVNDASGRTICRANGAAPFTTSEDRVKVWAIKAVFGADCPSPPPSGSTVVMIYSPRDAQKSEVVAEALVE